MTQTTQQIEEKALEGIDGFFTKLTEATDIITTKLIAAAPEAADALLNLVQFKGVFSLATEFIMLAAWATTGAIVVPKAYRWAKKFEDESSYSDGALYLVPIITGLIFGGVTLVSFYDFLSFYDWLSAFYPEGAIALKALEAVGISL